MKMPCIAVFKLILLGYCLLTNQRIALLAVLKVTILRIPDQNGVSQA